MRFSTSIISALLTASSVSGLNIILNNDDSWASANIRAFYNALKSAGHRVLLVAPAVNQSGKGGTTVFAASPNLTAPAEFNTTSANAPAWGSDPSDSSIWYYNGTPAAVTFFALDYLVPKLWNGTQPDLLVSGPNEGNNLGPFLFTLSGTIGATYSAVERGIPGIAFSAGNGTHRPYTAINGQYDVANLNAAAAVKVVQQLAFAASAANATRLLPYGYGINVNLPILNTSCSSPNFVLSRITGGAIVDVAVLNETTGVFTYGENYDNPGVNACINGNCSLPGETTVINSCSVSVSIFSTDYDAPVTNNLSNIQGYFSPLFANANVSSAIPPNNGTGAGNGTGTGSGNMTSGIGSPSASGSPQSNTNAAANIYPSTIVLLIGLFTALLTL